MLKELFGKIKAELLNRRRVVVEADRVFRGRRRLVDRSLVRWSFYESDTELLVVVDEELRGVLTFYKNTKIAEGRYGRMREIEL
ncbi:hypothetical protein KAU45_04510 [bacterium]|nr:hypothetical protein [bacterium]